MKTANEYARVAQEIEKIAHEVRPGLPDAPYADIRNLMVYHLRKTAADARKISEDIARKEPGRP